MKTNMRTFILCIFLSLGTLSVEGKRVIRDSRNTKILHFFKEANIIYEIRFHYEFLDTLTIPKGCELKFIGGSLKGCIFFTGTKLSGDVNLKGSSIHGSISNKIFDAGWLCNIDGQHDDASHINEMIEVCGHVVFPAGKYRLISKFKVFGTVPPNCKGSINSHIGINKNNITLHGVGNTEFITDEPLGTICIYSQPNQIKESIRNISIENIIFTVKNHGIKFYEFMHTIKVIGVNGLNIQNCKFNDFWGDAICLSHYGDSPATGERTRNMNVKILNNIIEGGRKPNSRNGISIINGQNVIICNNYLKNTSSENMPGGIDIEPNNSAYTIENVRIENNYFEGIKGFVGAIGLVLLRDEAPAHRISIIGNHIKSCKYGISIGITTQRSMDGLIIKNNYVAKDTHPYKFGGGGKSKNWVIEGNSFERYTKADIPGDIVVSNLRLSKKKLQ